MVKEKDILEEVMAKRLREMGINLKEKFRSSEKIAIEPVRIGMPGTKEEGIVFGPPKRDTPYPIDRVKVINEKGKMKK